MSTHSVKKNRKTMEANPGTVLLMSRCKHYCTKYSVSAERLKRDSRLARKTAYGILDGSLVYMKKTSIQKLHNWLVFAEGLQAQGEDYRTPKPGEIDRTEYTTIAELGPEPVEQPEPAPINEDGDEHLQLDLPLESGIETDEVKYLRRRVSELECLLDGYRSGAIC